MSERERETWGVVAMRYWLWHTHDDVKQKRMYEKEKNNVEKEGKNEYPKWKYIDPSGVNGEYCTHLFISPTFTVHTK